jgi:hypothetical protein
MVVRAGLAHCVRPCGLTLKDAGFSGRRGGRPSRGSHHKKTRSEERVLKWW